MKKYLEQHGIEVVDCEVIQYGAKEFAIKKPEGNGEVMPVLVDFAHGKPMFVIHSDHHDSQAGVEQDTTTSFKHSRSNVETISQTISPRDIFKDEDIKIISIVDSANYAVNKITPKMVMNFVFKYDKDKSVADNKIALGLVVNKLLLAYKNYPGLMEYLVMNSEPSIEGLFNMLSTLAKERNYVDIETMQKNQEKYIEQRTKQIQVVGNILTQFDLGSMRKGSYDRYTPFRIYPDADFLVTGMGGQVGMVQASCNPFKEERALKGVNLGEIKDEVLEIFKPELESQILPFKLIKRIAEREATEESVGFTTKDMMALYAKGPSYDPQTNSINGYDFLVANSGGHKCITNISGINFLYSNYDKPYTKDLPKETLPIVNYEGDNSFVKDIKRKLLRFRSLSEKQIQAAIRQMQKEGLDIEKLANPEVGRTYKDLVRDMKDKFVEILNSKIESEKGGESLNEELEGGKDDRVLSDKEIKLFKLINSKRSSLTTRDKMIDYIRMALNLIGKPVGEARFYYEVYTSNYRPQGDYENLTKDNFVDYRGFKQHKTSNKDAWEYSAAKMPFKGSNLEGEWDVNYFGNWYYVVKSYGWYPIFLYIDKQWYQVDDNYSNSTSKHLSHSRPTRYSSNLRDEIISVTLDEIKQLIGGKKLEDIERNRYDRFVDKGKEEITSNKKTKTFGWGNDAIKATYTITGVNVDGNDIIFDFDIHKAGKLDGRKMTPQNEYDDEFKDKLNDYLNQFIKSTYGEQLRRKNLVVNVKYPN
jgi:hypothetical protein